MNHHFTAALAATLAAASPALAAQRAISIPPLSISIAGGAANNGDSVTLAPTGSSSAYINFVLPPDYKPNTVVKIRLTMFTNTGFACAAHFSAKQAVRQRPGKAMYNNIEHFTIVNGPLVNSANAFVVLTKVFELRAPTGATFTGQKPGDSFSLQMDRDGDDPADNCPNFFFLRNIEVRYTSN